MDLSEQVFVEDLQKWDTPKLQAYYNKHKAKESDSNYLQTVKALLDRRIPPLEKRVFCFIREPAHYDMSCPECEEANELQWSEFKSHIWCDKCQKDQFVAWNDHHGGIFAGPIMIQTCEVLGIRFDRLYIEQDRILVQEEYLDCSEEEVDQKVQKGDVLLDGPQYLEYMAERQKFLESGIKDEATVQQLRAFQAGAFRKKDERTTT